MVSAAYPKHSGQSECGIPCSARHPFTAPGDWSQCFAAQRNVLGQEAQRQTTQSQDAQSMVFDGDCATQDKAAQSQDAQSSVRA
eukprot:12203515-Karenia_brevis.AAC.1